MSSENFDINKELERLMRLKPEELKKLVEEARKRAEEEKAKEEQEKKETMEKEKELEKIVEEAKPEPKPEKTEETSAEEKKEKEITPPKRKNVYGSDVVIINMMPWSRRKLVISLAGWVKANYFDLYMDKDFRRKIKKQVSEIADKLEEAIAKDPAVATLDPNSIRRALEIHLDLDEEGNLKVKDVEVKVYKIDNILTETANERVKKLLSTKQSKAPIEL